MHCAALVQRRTGIKETSFATEQQGDEPPAKRPKNISGEQVKAISSRAVSEHVGTTGERVVVERPVDEDKLRVSLQAVFDSGIRSLAVALLHSYTFKVIVLSCFLM